MHLSLVCCAEQVPSSSVRLPSKVQNRLLKKCDNFAAALPALQAAKGESHMK